MLDNRRLPALKARGMGTGDEVVALVPWLDRRGGSILSDMDELNGISFTWCRPRPCSSDDRRWRAFTGEKESRALANEFGDDHSALEWSERGGCVGEESLSFLSLADFKCEDTLKSSCCKTEACRTGFGDLRGVSRPMLAVVVPFCSNSWTREDVEGIGDSSCLCSAATSLSTVTGVLGRPAIAGMALLRIDCDDFCLFCVCASLTSCSDSCVNPLPVRSVTPVGMGFLSAVSASVTDETEPESWRIGLLRAVTGGLVGGDGFLLTLALAPLWTLL